MRRGPAGVLVTGPPRSCQNHPRRPRAQGDRDLRQQHVRWWVRRARGVVHSERCCCSPSSCSGSTGACAPGPTRSSKRSMLLMVVPCGTPALSGAAGRRVHTADMRSPARAVAAAAPALRLLPRAPGSSPATCGWPRAALQTPPPAPRAGSGSSKRVSDPEARLMLSTRSLRTEAAPLAAAGAGADMLAGVSPARAKT
jgi:hypothetical protein